MAKGHRWFQMVNIASGDYLLPANDGIHLWRLRKEQVPHTAEDGIHEIHREEWCLYRWKWSIENDADLQMIDLDDWEQWEWEYETTRLTRKELIEDANEKIPGPPAGMLDTQRESR